MLADADDAVFEGLGDTAMLDGVAVIGMFNAPWLQPQMGGMGTGIVEPHLVIRDGDLGAAGQGSTVAHDGRTYTVVSVEPDGTGLTALVLREVMP
jgi:hypothetical protein